MTPKIKMTVEFEVDKAQALALQHMFEFWTALGQQGSSRWVAFDCDGDGNFQPNCKVSFSEPIDGLTEEIRRATVIDNDTQNIEVRADFVFYYDTVYSFLRPANGS